MMNPQIRLKRRQETAKIVAIYSLFGLLWIYGSDTVLGLLVQDPDMMVKLAVIKGSLFIFCTAILLFFLINRFTRQLTAAEMEQVEMLQNYQAIFNATNEAIFVHDAQSSSIVDSNDRMLDIFGYTCAEVLSLDIGSLSEGKSPYSQTEAVEYVRKALMEGPQVFEWRSRKKSGELFWSEVSLRKITIRNLDRIIAVVRDISDRKKLDDALKASEARHRTLLDSAMDGFWIVSQQGMLLEVNDAYCRMSGYGKDELLTMGIADLDVIESATTVDAHIKKLMARGEDRFMAQHRRKDGSVFDVEISARHIPMCGGLIVCFLRDITERKRAEQTLRSSEAKFRSIVETSQDWIWEMELSGVHTFSNERGSEILGYSTEEFLRTDFMELVHQEDRDVILSRLPRLIADKSGWRGWVLRCRHKDGSYRFLESSANPIFDESGELVGYRGVDRDITDRKNAEAERLTLERQLLQAQKLESVGVLAGGIAHDFNNILTAIMGNISYARMDLAAGQHASEPLARAEKAAKRAAGLAKQLLAFSKGGEPVKKLISLRQTLHDAVALVLSGSSVEAAVDLPADLNPVNADEGQMGQAFHNIIINAVQAMPEGGRLTVSARNVTVTGENSPGPAAGDYVEISFADEGCGIAAEDLERIFDPYFTKKTDGSGLGLASAYTIITRHGGHISVSSSPGKGATFTILLPASGAQVREEVQDVQPPGVAHGVYSILVMDDDEMVRELADITLKRFGYEVVCCDNGAAAVALYRTTREEGVPFSLVIMDLTIPGGMGGIEAARQILAIDPDARLIVSSGYSEDPVMANYADYGFCAALEKPYNVEEIARILQTAVAKDSSGS